MVKKWRKWKGYFLWLIFAGICMGSIWMLSEYSLSEYSLVIVDVLEGKEYIESDLFQRALECEKEELREYFQIRNFITNDGLINEDDSFLSVARGFSSGNHWSLQELCEIYEPGEEYKTQLLNTEKAFWKKDNTPNSVFALEKHLLNDGVLFYDCGRLYELKDKHGDISYIQRVTEALKKNRSADVKFSSVGQGCYRMNPLPIGTDEDVNTNVYDMRTAQSLAKYMVQMYEYYRDKYESRNCNLTYRFEPGGLSANEDILYVEDESGSIEPVFYSSVSFDGVYHTQSYGLDDNLAKDLLLPTVLDKYYDDSYTVYSGYLHLDTSFEKEDVFYYGNQLYEKVKKYLMPLLVVGGLSFLCCIGWGIYIGLGWRREGIAQRDTAELVKETGRHLQIRGSFEILLLLCAASLAGSVLMILAYCQENGTRVLTDQEKIFRFIGTMVLLMAFIWLLKQLIMSLVLGRNHTCSFMVAFMKKVHHTKEYLIGKFYGLSASQRFGILIVSICFWCVVTVWFCSLAWTYREGAYMVGAGICLGAGVLLLFRNIVAQYRQYEFYHEVLEGVKRISGGELTYQLTGAYSPQGQDLIDAINQIAEGLQNAVEEQIKSERTKTRLITNVSHDIKTPLTSVINYIGLLKQENLQGERIREYLEVLDTKSQRLKVLIEDLIEASKISSGDIELHPYVWNLLEFLTQINGEFADRFAEGELELVSEMPEEPIMVWADSQRILRVIENLYINIYKYALPKTRIYLEVKQEEQAVIILRNISREQVKINPEELTERFVRGEEARSSDGSGLGLSIAKNLLELHGGSITIYTEGDLFRVTVTLPLAQEEH